MTQPPAGTFYGGCAGFFIDPDGHAWEIAHNPGFPLGEDGSITVPDFSSCGAVPSTKLACDHFAFEICRR